ncbi:pullulanase-associated domain-containing protein [Chitinivorax sp. B]|uniref:pullulanase-associated domain-containing protein n=1 Tax=Chitinivorax sp. B TaxID=2502235 RepID=UPI0010F7ED1B|nr:pullulanase-associated domain-containing protein [Chitinivorax sp. B]
MLSKRNFLKWALVAVWSASASLTLAGEQPDDVVTIHYSRPDGAYEGWGLHVWRREGGTPDMPLDGVDWHNPAKISGKDDFGVYWQRKVAEFGKSGVVYYIIHKGDRKEQGGKDMQFDTKQTREIWVNAGDRNIYLSLEAALKARQN